MSENDVWEQQIAISEVEFNSLVIEGLIESWVRANYNIPYHRLPYCYGCVWIGEKDDPLAGSHMFLFRDKPLKDSRRRAWAPSPSTKNRLRNGQ